MDFRETQVCNFIDEIKDEIVELLKDMVAMRSDNPPGNTREVAEVIAKKLDSYKIPYEEIVVDEIYRSLVATIGKGGKNLLLNGHIDTVPVGDPDQWNVDPYNEPLHENVMYGRGCADDKGGVAAMVMAACALKKCGVELSGRLTVNPAADEEEGGIRGVKYLLENNYLSPDLVVVGECTENDVAIIHNGLIWIKITSCGKTAHASSPWNGTNAISKMIKFLSYLENHYEKVLSKHTHLLTPPPTYNIGTIQGGVRVNVVPDICTVLLDRRILPSETLEETMAEIQGIAEEFMRKEGDAELSFEMINYSPPVNTSPDELLVEEAIKIVSGFGRKDHPVGYQQNSDGRYFSMRGIPTVLIGPGLASVGHCPNESICVDEVVECTKIYAVLAMRVLGYLFQ